MADYDATRARLAAEGQEHVLAGWQDLSPADRGTLLADCAGIDFGWLRDRQREAAGNDPAGGRPAAIEPAPVVRLPAGPADKKKWAEATGRGEELLRSGKAAAFLVAGGQGSRLGFDGPKGCYPVGPVSGRTLFGWHAGQIRARSRRYGSPIPWYIMTSRENDAATRAFFRVNHYFGLAERDVFFFPQDMVPCLDLDGKLMLSGPGTLAMNPNGHGGALAGMRSSGALADMQSRGIEVISSFQVDNPLTTICDPAFLGWHAGAGAEMSSKVLRKVAPDEKLGVLCSLDGRTGIVEYIDLDDTLRNAVGPDGGLLYWAGSIAVHMIDVSFVERLTAPGGAGLPWHQSRKKVPFYRDGKIHRPEHENAVKFETFVFDALPFANKTLNLEVRRATEFAPIKNATGADSPASCRSLLSARFLSWLAAAGIQPAGDVQPIVEISPLYSLDAAELAGKIKPDGVRLERGLLLE